MNVEPGQIWRNTFGGHVVIGDRELYTPPGHTTPYEVLWVHPCDATGALADVPRIPMEPDFGTSPMWTQVGGA